MYAFQVVAYVYGIVPGDGQNQPFVPILFFFFLFFLLYVEINRLLKKVLEGLWLFFIMI